MKSSGIMLTLVGFISLAVLVAGGDDSNKDLRQYDDLGDNMEIVGYGDDCDESGSFCDKRSGLTCNAENICECDYKKSLSYNNTSLKCVQIVNGNQNDQDYYYDFAESNEDYQDDDEVKLSKNDSDPSSSSSAVKGTNFNEVDSQSEENNEGQRSENKSKDAEPEIEVAPQEIKPKSALTQSAPSEQDSSDETPGENKKYFEDNTMPKMRTPLQDTPINQSDSSAEISNNSSSNLSDYDEDEDNASYEYQDGIAPVAEDSLELDSIGCTKDAQCQIQRGKYSRCLVETGTCECFDTENTGKNVILVNDTTCFIDLQIGDACKSHAECDAVISGDAWCHSDIGSEVTSCQCQPFHIWDADWKECLPLAVQGLDSPCKSDAQCNSEQALGRHARCSEVTGFCECSNSLGSETKPLVFYELKCVEETDLNGTCTTDQDCEASLGVLAYCSAETLTCSCIEENKCQKVNFRPMYTYDQPQLSGFSMIIIGLLAVGTLIAAFLCVALRRNDTYGFVTLENEV